MAIRRNLSPNPGLKNNTTGNATSWTSSPSGYARQTGVSGMSRTTGFGGIGQFLDKIMQLTAEPGVDLNQFLLRLLILILLWDSE